HLELFPRLVHPIQRPAISPRLPPVPAAVNATRGNHLWGAQAASLQVSAACRDCLEGSIHVRPHRMLPATAGWQPALPGVEAERPKILCVPHLRLIFTRFNER